MGQHRSFRRQAQGRRLEPESYSGLGLENSNPADLSRFGFLWQGIRRRRSVDGDATLSLDPLPNAFQPVSELDPLSQEIYEMIRLEPAFTGTIRKKAIAELSTTKSRFDTALKKLQISLNIVRSNDPQLKNDFWLTMREVHLDIVSEHE